MDRTDRTWRIGALARETGLTVRTLHHYDAVGLVTPSRRTSGGHRVYLEHDVERLYAVAALRQMGMPLAAIAAHLERGWDLTSIAREQARALDAEIAALSALRHRLTGLQDDEQPADLIRLVRQARPFVVRQVLALLPYDDLVEAQHRLEEMFGFEPGPVARNPDGAPAHAVVLAGTGFVHLHPPTDDVRPPGPGGPASAIVVASVADVDAHAAHAREHGARITYGPLDTAYHLREYGACDHAGHHWSFQAPLGEEPR